MQLFITAVLSSIVCVCVCVWLPVNNATNITLKHGVLMPNLQEQMIVKLMLYMAKNLLPG